MASPKMKEAASKFPEGDADAELNPGKNKSVEVDPKASEVTSLQIKVTFLFCKLLCFDFFHN